MNEDNALGLLSRLQYYTSSVMSCVSFLRLVCFCAAAKQKNLQCHLRAQSACGVTTRRSCAVSSTLFGTAAAASTISKSSNKRQILTAYQQLRFHGVLYFNRIFQSVLESPSSVLVCICVLPSINQSTYFFCIDATPSK